MKVLESRVHGILDYGMVLLFLLAPTLFGLGGVAATISYVLAAVHFLLTVVTAFPLGLTDLVPLKVHGMIELVVSIVLIIAPWLMAGVFSATAQIFYTVVGIVILIVWALTDYGPAQKRVIT